MHPLVLAFIGTALPFLSGVITYWLSPFSSFRTFWISALLTLSSGSFYAYIFLKLSHLLPSTATAISLAPLSTSLQLGLNAEALLYLLLLSGIVTFIALSLSVFLSDDRAIGKTCLMLHTLHGCIGLIILNNNMRSNAIIFGVITMVFFLAATQLYLKKGFLHGLKIMLCLLPLTFLCIGASGPSPFIYSIILIWIVSGLFPLHFWHSDVEDASLGTIIVFHLAGLPFLSGFLWLQLTHNLQAHTSILTVLAGASLISAILIGFSALIATSSRSLICRLSLANQHLFIAFIILSSLSHNMSLIYLALFSLLIIQLALALILAIIERVTNTTDLSKIGSLFNYAPIAGFGLILVFISALGSPLTIGYFIFNQFMASIPAQNSALLMVGYGIFSLAQIAILATFIRLIVFGFFNAVEDGVKSGFVRASLLAQTPVLVGGILMVLLGVFPNDFSILLSPIYAASQLVTAPQNLTHWAGLDNTFYWSIIMVFIAGLAATIASRFSSYLQLPIATHFSALLNGGLNLVGSASERIRALFFAPAHHLRATINVGVFTCAMAGILFMSAHRLDFSWLGLETFDVSILSLVIIVLLISSLLKVRSAALASVHLVIICVGVALVLAQSNALFLASITLVISALFLLVAIQLFRAQPSESSLSQFPQAFNIKSWDWAYLLLSILASFCIIIVASHAGLLLDALPIGELVIKHVRFAAYPSEILGFFADLHAVYTIVFALALCSVFLMHRRSGFRIRPITTIRTQVQHLAALFSIDRHQSGDTHDNT